MLLILQTPAFLAHREAIIIHKLSLAYYVISKNLSHLIVIKDLERTDPRTVRTT